MKLEVFKKTKDFSLRAYWILGNNIPFELVSIIGISKRWNTVVKLIREFGVANDKS